MERSLLRAQSGEFRHYVTIQARTESGTDAIRRPTYTWADVFPAWASIESLGASESVSGERRSTTTTYRVRMRKCYDVTTAHRLSFGARTLDIEAVFDVGEVGKVLELSCKETT